MGPLDVAKAKDHQDVARLLESHGARQNYLELQLFGCGTCCCCAALATLVLGMLVLFIELPPEAFYASLGCFIAFLVYLVWPCIEIRCCAKCARRCRRRMRGARRSAKVRPADLQ